MLTALTRWCVARPVATVMSFLALVVVGVVSFRSLPVDLLPAIEFTQLTVRVRYPNVGPEEIEQIITSPIENAVSGLPNLTRVVSSSEEGTSRVRLDFARGTNVDEAANDLRAALDRIRATLPLEAEPPEIFKLDLDREEVVTLVATTTRPLADLTRMLEREVSRRFKQIPGVGSIELRGGIYREIRVELDRDRLLAAGLTALDVEGALARENVVLPGGRVKAGVSDLYVRSHGAYESVDEIAGSVVKSEAGAIVRVGEVAEVRDGYRDVDYLAEVNGVPSVSMNIQKQSGANTVQVASRILQEVERINNEREDLHLMVTSDQSEFIEQSIANVRSSALWGSLLAIVILYLFLRSRAATAVIAVSIPISVVATFGLLYFGGLTLNQMTFGGLALGVGLIVDNAIVVLENIVRKRQEEGADPITAAQVGTADVTGAIVASTATTCVIFLPVVFTRTTSAALFRTLALVVVFALVCSLLVALTLVPMLSARLIRARPLNALDPSEPARRRTVMRRLEDWYTRRLRSALRHRGRVFLATGALLALALTFWGDIPVELAPQTDTKEIDVQIQAAEGTNVAVVRPYIDELEGLVRQVVPAEEVRVVSTEIRGSRAEVEVSLVPVGQRALTSAQLADRIRQAVEGRIPGVEVEVAERAGLGILRHIFSAGGGNSAIQIELRGWDLEQAEEVARQLKEIMEATPGVVGVRVSRREGRPEERMEIDRERVAQLGLSVRDVARTLQANVGGVQASRLRDGGDEYPITVRLRPEDRLVASDLDGIALRTPAGAMIPLSAVVDSQAARGPLRVDRIDGQRVTYLTAGVQSGVSVGDVIESLQETFASVPLPDGFSVLFGGEYREQQDAQRDFTIAIVLALVLVYMLMAAQFERLVDPLVVMLSVPVSLIGVVPALLLTNTTINIQSVMGLVMLVGLVVNNAIVLVDSINQLRRERGLDAATAALEAGRLRLRPILMTTTTTVLGLLPLALGWGTGAEIQAALARTVTGGLVASTLVTLLVIPTAYTTAAEGLRRLGRFSARRPDLALGVEPR